MDEWPGVTGPRVLPAYGRERALEGGVEDPRVCAVVSHFAKGARLRLSKHEQVQSTSRHLTGVLSAFRPTVRTLAPLLRRR